MPDSADREKNLQSILQSPSYRVAYTDVDFLTGPRMRAARMELEFLKPELAFQDENIQSTIVVFGSTRIVEPDEARRRLANARARLAESPGEARCSGASSRPSGCWRRAAITRRRGSSLAWLPRRPATTGRVNLRF